MFYLIIFISRQKKQGQFCRSWSLLLRQICMQVILVKGIQVSNKNPYFHSIKGDNNNCTLVIIFYRQRDNFNQTLFKEVFSEVHGLMKVSLPHKRLMESNINCDIFVKNNRNNIFIFIRSK